MTEPSESQGSVQFAVTDLALIASAIDAAAEGDDRSHHDLPHDALSRFEEQALPPPLRLAVSQTFFRGLRLIDYEDPSRIGVELAAETGEDSADILLLCRALSASLTHPMPKSLVHDVLFVRRDGDVGQHAREAIRLYLQTATIATVSRHIRVYSALRALTLAKRTSAVRELLQIALMLREMVEQDLADARNQPGLTLPMAAAVVDIALCEPGRVSGTSDLLESVLDRYGTPDHIDYIAQLFRLTNDVTDERKAFLRRARVTTRLDRARNETTPELKLFRLEDAARAARDLGYSDLYDEAIAELQQVDTQTMNWVVVGSDLQYPPEVVAAYIGEYTFHGDWRRGLRQWLATGPPSGHFDDNKALARNSLEGSVLQSLFPRFRIGSHGMPERRTPTDENLAASIRDVEYRHALVEGVLLSGALKAIGQLANNASERDVTTFIIDSYRCPAVNASILAKALRLFWDSECLVCAYFVTPSIEAGVRTLLLELNAAIYRVEQGKTKGQYAQLGSILPKLEDEGFDKDWIRFIQTLTLGDGQNYRNDIAHGFMRQMDEIVATLLLRAGALFLIMPVEASTTEELRQLAARPTPERPRRSFRRRVSDSISAAWRSFRRP